MSQPKKEYDITDFIMFGKHAGELVGTVIENEPSYIEWLLANTDFRLNEDALQYLEENQ